MPRPFRVELAEAKRMREQSPMSQEVHRILGDLHVLRSQAGRVDAIDTAIAMWSGVDDIQKRIDVTKTEISALHQKGVADPSNSRTAEELRAVVTGTEMATDTILAAAERIDGIVQPLLGDTDSRTQTNAQEIADAVIEIFEACNFQDIAGQRISKVVESLQFIEQRIANMVDVWRALDLRPKKEPEKEKERSDRDLLNGPALATDANVVSQDDVDALFR
jgi:chemotaxis protein CheZ